MNLIKLGAAALNQTPLDWEGNKKNIIDVIEQAHEKNVNVLCLPELCVTGYGCEDSFFMPHVLRKAWDTVLEIEEEIMGLAAAYKSPFIISVGCPVMCNGAIYNCTVLMDNLGIKGIVPKKNLCSDGVHYESRWFKAWKPRYENDEDFFTFTWDLKNRNSKHSFLKKTSALFGDVTVSYGNIKVGVEICEDAWVPNRPGIKLSEQGVNVIINPSASHFSFGKNKIRERFVEEGSRAFNCAYVYSNLLGNESGRVIFDGDTYIASQGAIVSKGNRFSFKDTLLTTAVVDLDKNTAKSVQIGSRNVNYEQPKDYLYRSVNTPHTKEGGNVNPITTTKFGPFYDLNSHNYDSFTKAVGLGLWDYMLKSKSKGFVLSLSGGADSAAVACLVRSMVICAYNELGPSVLWDKLYSVGIKLPKLSDLVSGTQDALIKSIVREILLCVYQGTENSSEKTEEAARYLASETGANYKCINVQKVVDEYVALSAIALDRTPDWENDDIAMQNIQARVRAPSVWMLANIRGALLLSTSNRSEAAVGYATMDGDTCGGLSPIAGVSKVFILEWLENYLSSYKTHDFHGLDKVMKLKPTAELRPPEEEQTDEDDLMPYDILNQIEEMVVKYKMSPRDIRDTLKANSVNNSTAYVVKFFKMFCRNQWKRERYAPSFHLDDESLDPKTFYRFPILNSGFEEELQELLREEMNKALE